MKTTQYLDAVKRRLGISSDYALAKALDLTRFGVSKLRRGDHTMSTTTAAKIAEILELEPLQVIADAEIERGSSPELWKRIRAAAAIAGAVLAGAVLYLALMNERSAFDIASISGAFPMNGDALAFALGLFNSNTHCVAIALAIGATWWILRRRPRILAALAIAASASSAASIASAGEPWASSDRALLGGALGVMAVDWLQTRDLARQVQWNRPECADADFRAAPLVVGEGFCRLEPRYREINPLLPDHPSEHQVDQYFALAMLGTAGLAFALPSPYRRYFLGGVVVLEAAIVLRNHSIGLRVAF